jgi:hypothetical protein
VLRFWEANIQNNCRRIVRARINRKGNLCAKSLALPRSHNRRQPLAADVEPSGARVRIVNLPPAMEDLANVEKIAQVRVANGFAMIFPPKMEIQKSRAQWQVPGFSMPRRSGTDFWKRFLLPWKFEAPNPTTRFQ